MRGFAPYEKTGNQIRKPITANLTVTKDSFSFFIPVILFYFKFLIVFFLNDKMKKIS